MYGLARTMNLDSATAFSTVGNQPAAAVAGCNRDIRPSDAFTET